MVALNPMLKTFSIVVNGIECASAASGEQWLQLNYPKHGQDGLYPCTGTITLLPVQGFSNNFFNPRKNRSQWRRGRRVEISVQRVNQASLQREFTGYILKRPATPATEDGALVISIGCELAYRDVAQPAEDKAGVKLGNTRSRTAIISRITSGWDGTWGGSISEYRLNYPVPKYQGSFVKQMGKLAASACYGLWCDRFGNLQAVKLTRSPAHLFSRSFKDTFLEATDGSDEPAFKVRAVVSGRNITPTPRSDLDVIEQQGSIFLRDGRLRDYVVKRTTFEEQWSSTYKTLVSTTTVEVPLIDENDRIRLVIKTITVETKEYSRGLDGKLSTRTVETFTGSEFTGIAGQTSPIRTQRELEEWTYDGEVPRSQRTEIYQLIINADGNEEEVLERSLYVGWEELGGDRWQRTEGFYRPLILADGRVIDVGDSEVFRGRKYRPGEPERHVPTHSSEAVSYQGEACFGGVADENEEPVIYEFEYGVSNAQADRLAELHGAVLVGRDSGWMCSLEYGEEWLNWTPASGVRLTLPDGDIGLFLIDGVSRNFSSGFATVSFGAVDMGTVGRVDVSRIPRVIIGNAPQPAPQPTFEDLTPPYEVIVTGTHSADAAFMGDVVLNADAPAAGLFTADASFDGGDPEGDSFRVFSADAAFIGGG